MMIMIMMMMMTKSHFLKRSSFAGERLKMYLDLNESPKSHETNEQDSDNNDDDD